mgnify:FL=1
MFTVLVVEDDQPLSRLFGTILGRNGYNVHTVCTASAALHCLEQEYVDLIITDVMLPGMDGFELIRQLRESGSTLPILLVTAQETLADKERGFTAGADDYMVKPVEVEELLLRVRALLRSAQMISQRKLTVGTTRLDYDTLTLTQNGEEEILPQKECFLLYKLLSYPGHIYTRQQLMDEIWGLESESELRTVDVHINRLRERLRWNQDVSIVTIRGLGYKGVRLCDETKRA